MTKEKTTQKTEMMKYGINFGREILDLIRNDSTKYQSEERVEDANWLEKEMTDANRLLDEKGEFDEQTILQMRIVVKLNGILCRRYLGGGK